MRLELAAPGSGPELRKFFEQFAVDWQVELRVKRPHDFFAPYKIQGGQYETLILREEDESLHGLASFIFRDTFFEDRVQKIGIATDLRIQPSRKSILSWSQHFLPVLRDTIKRQGVTSVLSVINPRDQAAFNAFVRPRQIKRAMPRYHLYRKFQLVSLHGRFPWAPGPVSGLRLRRGENRWFGPMMDHIRRRAPYRAFGSLWDEKSFFNKIENLPGMKLEDFYLAFDSSEKVVGMMAPWSPLQTQEYCPLTYNLRAHNFRQFLKFGRLFGWTRPLTKPLTRTGAEAPLKFRFLTSISVENEDIFESLLWLAFEDLPKDEFLVYGHCLQDFRLNPPTSWVAATLPFGLYAILPPELDPPAFLHPTQTSNPEIEAAYFF